MTPVTFEAYRIAGRLKWVQFIAGYVAQIKQRNATTFTSMSEQAGAPKGRERGMFMVGARFTPTTDINFGAITYYVPDTWNILYTEANYTWPLTAKLGLKLQGQFTEQDSVGGDNFIGKFNTRVGGAQAALSYNKVILRAAFSITADTKNINSPYGSYPGYLSLIEKDFDRAEKGLVTQDSLTILRTTSQASARPAILPVASTRVNPSTNGSVSNENEWDITLDYRIEEDPCRTLVPGAQRLR